MTDKEYTAQVRERIFELWDEDKETPAHPLRNITILGCKRRGFNVDQAAEWLIGVDMNR